MTDSYWKRSDWSRVFDGPQLLPLAQGDFLPDCGVPVVPNDFDAERKVQVGHADLIVITQTCDLANGKAAMVALCRAYTLQKYEELIPAVAKKGRWEEIRQSRREGLHLLGGRDNPDDNRQAILVDFHEIHSLPVGYLRRHAEQLGPRDRLQSPFLEHFSQAFARFFMRVGLPSAIPAFK